MRSLFHRVEDIYARTPPEIVLANKPYLAYSEHANFPRLLKYAEHEDMEVIALDKNTSASVEYVAAEIKSMLKEKLVSSGAILIRNLHHVVNDSKTFSKLVADLGERMPYIAGMATRAELDESPGVMNASDDPEECTLEPHLEMCYRQEMPSK